jgi:hypothetical protein
MRYALAWALSFGALFFLWMVYVGEWNAYEWVAAACTAGFSAGAVTLLYAKGLLRFPFPLAMVRRSALVLPMVVVDFGIITVALFRSLARGRLVHGTFVVREPEVAVGGKDPRGRGRRAWASWLSAFSPNAYVIDIDPDDDTVLLHDMIPNRSSESPL